MPDSIERRHDGIHDAEQRGFAHPGFIARKVIASGATGRRAVYMACRAEMDWVYRLPYSGQDWGLGVINAADPLTQAAAAVVNAWGHLQPMETRLLACWSRLHAQRRAGWTASASETAADLRWYLAERRKIAKRFDALAEVYHEKRARMT